VPEPALAEETATGFEGIEAPRGEADDLKLVPGITDKVEQGLNGAGVFHYWQIADLTDNGVKLLDETLKLEDGTTSRAWIEPAKKLVEAAAA